MKKTITLTLEVELVHDGGDEKGLTAAASILNGLAGKGLPTFMENDLLTLVRDKMYESVESLYDSESYNDIDTFISGLYLNTNFERAVDGAGKGDGQRYFIITLDTHRGSKAHVDNVLMAVNEGDDPASLIHGYGCEYYEDGEYDEDEGVLVCVDEYSRFIVGWNHQEITRAEYDVMVKYISRAWGYTAEVK